MSSSFLPNKVFRLYVVSTEEEALPIIEYFNLFRINATSIRDGVFTHINYKTLGPNWNILTESFKIFSNPIGLENILIISGVGKVKSSIAAATGITLFDPSEVINIGLCGTLKPKIYKNAQILNVSKVFQHDCYVPIKGKNFDELFEIITLDTSKSKNNPKLSQYECVKLATGDSFIDNKNLRNNLAEIADIVDMEGYSIAKTCLMMNKSLQIFKMIAYSLDRNSKRDFIRTILSYKKNISLFLENL